jgi:hypothetical protein
VPLDEIAVDTPYQQMPPLDPEKRQALKTSMAERGIQDPIHLTPDRHIVMGHHRVDVARELFATGDERFAAVPALVYAEERTADEWSDLALELELARRHLNTAEMADLILRQIRLHPVWPDRALARKLACSPSTIAKYRALLAVQSGDAPPPPSAVQLGHPTHPDQTVQPGHPDLSPIVNLRVWVRELLPHTGTDELADVVLGYHKRHAEQADRDRFEDWCVAWTLSKRWRPQPRKASPAVRPKPRSGA